MAPVSLDDVVEEYLNKNLVMIFSKSSCPFCTKVKELFESLSVPYYSLELDNVDNGPEIQKILELKTGQKTVPNVFVKGTHVGGCDKTLEAHKNGSLEELMGPIKKKADYDLIVIGGGSGGLAAAKEAATLGAKVAVLDFVKATPLGTTWGLGGTCVNVGCIPKKLMHHGALLGKCVKDSENFGWKLHHDETKEKSAKWNSDMPPVAHDWDKLRESVQNHIASQNWSYRINLREKKVDYINAYATFIKDHAISAMDKRGKATTLIGSKFLLATGMRPRYPDIPGAKEYCITSDDLFSLKYPPGKTLCVGASYVSLECAGFLRQLGYEVEVMVRSILLRGFDQQMANLVGDNLKQLGIKFHEGCVPTSVERLEPGEPGKLKVSFTDKEGKTNTEEYNTVLFAIGRDACTKDLNLDAVGVKINPKNGKIPVTHEQTNIPYIYAVGDILEDKLELTPVAIQAGILLSKRLFGRSNVQCDYENVPTTVFTPVEYSCVGYAEEYAIAKFGEDKLEVYHSSFTPMENAVAGDFTECYVKMICLKTENEKVIGLHLLCPNSGEIMQGFALAVKLGATKADFDAVIGIHPTIAEVLTTLTVTKSSGQGASVGGC